MLDFQRLWILAIVLAVLVGVRWPDSIAKAFHIRPVCDFGEVRFDNQFPTARLDSCKQLEKNIFSLAIIPESEPINPSPWYHFSVASHSNQNIVVLIHTPRNSVRYLPKVSYDGKKYQQLSDDNYQKILNGTVLRLELNVTSSPIYIAAQPPVNLDLAHQKLTDWQASSNGQIVAIGHSTYGQQINGLLLQSEREKHANINQEPVRDKREKNKQIPDKWIVIIGHQHPPETTGIIALHEFVEQLLIQHDKDTAISSYNLLVVPMVNPDGVFLGHWRYNANNVDLNRDWHALSQVETRVIDRYLEKIHASGGQFILGIDFHSTYQSLFYLPIEDLRLCCHALVADWLSNFAKSDQSVTHPQHIYIDNLISGSFKNYFMTKYNAPGITYEIGDEVPVSLIRSRAKQSALALVHALSIQ